MDTSPESKIHHLKEALEENSPRNKIPQLLLILFVATVGILSLIYTYHFRDLPKCKDEEIQILLNENLRSNESLINHSQTLAFDRFNQISQDDANRSCSVNLMTSQGNYVITYQIINELGRQSVFSRIYGAVRYVVVVQGAKLIQ